MITIDVFDDQSHVPLDHQRLRRAVRMVLQEASVTRAQISVAVVDDDTIRRLHCRYLDQDEPTDVLSFALDPRPQHLDAEVIVSAETAAAAAGQFGWAAQDELLLYVLHGMLHLVGCDDTTPEKQAQMHRREEACLARFGLKARRERSGTELAGGAAPPGPTRPQPAGEAP